MNLREFKECVEFNIKHEIRHAVLGLGAPGVGKSQVVRQIGEELGYKVIDLRLAQMSEVEIGGLIYPNADRTKTRWLAPEVLPDEERDGKKTILLLDEITSCPKRVQVAAYQLILDRRVGQYRLPEGTFVIGLGNREDDDGVYIHLAGPLADRFEIHFIDVDFKTWKNDFAIPYGIHKHVIDYLNFKRVSDILKCDSDITKPVVFNKIAGNIGEVEAAQFIQFVGEKGDNITVDDYLEKKVEAPKDHDKAAILINALVDRVSFLKNVPDAESLSQEERQEAEKIIDAVFRLGVAEHIIIGVRDLLEINRTVVRQLFLEMDNQEIDKFLADNMYMLGD